MAGPNVRVQTAETEAAAWHARLGALRVSTQEVEAFFAWRQDPLNADAYRRVEQVWGKAGDLRNDPAIQAAADEAMNRGRRGRTFPGGRGVMFGAAMLAAVAALSVGYVVWQQARTSFVTGVGEQRLVQLADGSSVRLDTASRVRVRFDGERRLVDLVEGQALFDVAHDAKRPFIVVAGDATVTAVGTVFDVQREGNGASVTLVSGLVELSQGKGRRERMTAGHRARMTPAGAVVQVADVAFETNWTEGRIVFRDTPLSEAVAEVNRYLPTKIQLDAGRLAGSPVNGVFRTEDRDAFVSAATQVFDLQASTGPDGAVRLSEREK